MIQSVFHVALGGAIGSVARFLTVAAMTRALGPGFPWGTLVVNVSGSLVMGALFVWLTAQGAMQAAPFLLTGVLGGFTTFSAFSLDAARLWQEGAAVQAGAYMAGSAILSIAALVAGMGLARGMMA